MAIVWAALSERTFEVGPTQWEVSSKVVIFFEVSKYIWEKVCGEDNWRQFIVNFCQFKDNSGS